MKTLRRRKRRIGKKATTYRQPKAYNLARNDSEGCAAINLKTFLLLRGNKRADKFQDNFSLRGAKLLGFPRGGKLGAAKRRRTRLEGCVSETTARLSFWCPECGASNNAYLNIGAVRKKGENETDCCKCRARITIGIDVMAELVELLQIERDEKGMPTAIRL